MPLHVIIKTKDAGEFFETEIINLMRLADIRGYFALIEEIKSKNLSKRKHFYHLINFMLTNIS